MSVFDTSIVLKWFSKKEDVNKAIELARKYDTSIYDTLFWVVAKKHNTTLITADEKFAHKCNDSDVILISTRVSSKPQ